MDHTIDYPRGRDAYVTVDCEPGTMTFRVARCRMLVEDGKPVLFFADFACDGSAQGRRDAVRLIRGAQWPMTLHLPGAGDIKAQFLVQWGANGLIEGEMVTRPVVMGKRVDLAGLARHLWGAAALRDAALA